MEIKKIDVVLKEDDHIWAGGYSGDQSVVLCFGGKSTGTIDIRLPASRAPEIVKEVRKAIKQAKRLHLGE